MIFIFFKTAIISFNIYRSCINGSTFDGSTYIIGQIINHNCAFNAQITLTANSTCTYSSTNLYDITLSIVSQGTNILHIATTNFCLDIIYNGHFRHSSAKTCVSLCVFNINTTGNLNIIILSDILQQGIYGKSVFTFSNLVDVGILNESIYLIIDFIYRSRSAQRSKATAATASTTCRFFT